MTDLEILKNSINILGAISVPINLIESIGVPIYQVKTSLQVLRNAVEENQKKKQQDEEDVNIELFAGGEPVETK